MVVIHAIILYGLAANAQTGPGGVSSGTGNVVFWLDGRRVNADGSNPTIGSTVSTWYDQSGNGVNVTENQANVATYSANGVTFNNTGYLQGSDATFPLGNNPRTVIVCASSPSTNADDVLFFYGTAANNQSYGVLKIMSTSGTAPNGVRSYYYNNDFNIAGGWTPSGTTKIITATHNNAPNSQDVYVNNGAVNNRTPTVPNTVSGAQGVQIGGWNSFGLYSQATISEVILYSKVLNQAERYIINNYLAAKYGITITNELYDNDDVANGNYDYNVAGIGQATGVANSNTNAASSIVRIFSPTGLSNNEYYIWGHDNGALSPVTTDLPAGIQARLVRIWRGSETGTITNFDVAFDMTGLGPVTASNLRLLIDTDNDGTFADETPLAGAALLSGNEYWFNNVTGLNNDIRFTLATINSTQTPLPVELTSFTASQEDQSVVLSWSTASELNSDHFTIERSNNGHLFEWVGEHPAAGTSLQSHAYELIDHEPYSGLSYYRLSQVDYDGTTKVYPLISVQVNVSGPFIRIHPNPTRGDFQLEVSGMSDNPLTITLCDTRGREVYRSVQTPTRAHQSVPIMIAPKLAAGLYLVRVSDGVNLFVQKLRVSE